MNKVAFFRVSCLYTLIFFFCGNIELLLGMSSGSQKIPIDDSDVVDLDKSSNSFFTTLAPKNISNFYISFTGRMLKRHPVLMFLAIKTEGDNTEVSGLYVQKRNHVNMELLGKAGSEGFILYEVSRKSSGRIVTNKMWTLTDRGNNKWRAVSQKRVMNLQVYQSSPTQFKYLGRSVNPQMIGLLFEKIKGSHLSVNVRNYNNRPYKQKGEWLQANLEYGYIRYRVLTNWYNSWILETQRSEGINTSFSREIIHTVLIKDELILFRIIDQNFQPDSIISQVFVEKESIVYKKKVNGEGLVNSIYDFYSDLEWKYITKFLSKQSPNSFKSFKKTKKWCGMCSYVTLTIDYEVNKNHKTIKNLELKPATSSLSNQAVYKDEKEFNQIIDQYHSEGMTILNFEQMKKLINSWLQKIL